MAGIERAGEATGVGVARAGRGRVSHAGEEDSGGLPRGGDAAGGGLPCGGDAAGGGEAGRLGRQPAAGIGRGRRSFLGRGMGNWGRRWWVGRDGGRPVLFSSGTVQFPDRYEIRRPLRSVRNRDKKVISRGGF